MANSRYLWQQKLLYLQTINFSLLTSRCKTIHSRLTFRCIRNVSVTTHRSCIPPYWQRNTSAFGNSRPASIFTTSQRRFLGHFTHLLPLTGTNCVPRHPLPPLGHTLISALHSGSVASAKEKKDTRPKSKDGEVHGSVLMEMIKSQDQQPKQLTIGTRGMYMHNHDYQPEPACERMELQPN